MGSPAPTQVQITLDASTPWRLDGFRSPEVPGVTVTRATTLVTSDEADLLVEAAARSGIRLLVEGGNDDTESESA